MTDDAHCQLCGQPLPEASRAAEREQRVELWRHWCLENGRRVTPDNRVRADVAAELLGVEEHRLKNWRYQGKPPRWHAVGKFVMYDLHDLAELLEVHSALSSTLDTTR